MKVPRSIYLWAVLLVACFAMAKQIPTRGIDPDELEHLHAAYCVHRGDVPYRDFFEHHSPALYYVIQPLFWIFGPELDVLWWGRGVMFVCSLITLGLTAILARRIAGPATALPAVCLLAWTTIFQTKGIELRPDVPATLLVILCSVIAFVARSKTERPREGEAPAEPGMSIDVNSDSRFGRSLALPECLSISPRISWCRCLIIGLVGGLATLFTQKSIVPIAALTIAITVQEARLFSKAGLLWACLRIPTFIAVGGAIAWCIAIGLFALGGAADDLLYSTVYQLWIWPIRTDRWEHLRPTLAADLTVWFAAGMEVLFVARQLLRSTSETWRDLRTLLALIVALCSLSLLIVKASYAQFYLLWLPLVAIAAATRLVAWADVVPGDPRSELQFRWIVNVLAFVVIVGEALLLLRVYGEGESTYWGALAGLFIAFVFAKLLQNRAWTIALLAAMGLFFGGVRNADRFEWSQDGAHFIIAALHRQVGPEETVLDGFTGYAALRPHAYYYWWINEYSLALMSPEDRESRLLEHLKAHPPAAVLYDGDLGLLPRPVLDWIESHYHESSNSRNVIWLRNQPP